MRPPRAPYTVWGPPLDGPRATGHHPGLPPDPNCRPGSRPSRRAHATARRGSESGSRRGRRARIDESAITDTGQATRPGPSLRAVQDGPVSGTARVQPWGSSDQPLVRAPGPSQPSRRCGTDLPVTSTTRRTRTLGSTWPGSGLRHRRIREPEGRGWTGPDCGRAGEV